MIWYFHRFGGRLHIDTSSSVEGLESIAMVHDGKKLWRDNQFDDQIIKGNKKYPGRCKRVWLGATDLEEEGVWRDSETEEVVDLSPFWSAGQPNGVRIQNCAGIWELVKIPTTLNQKAINHNFTNNKLAGIRRRHVWEGTPVFYVQIHLSPPSHFQRPLSQWPRGRVLHPDVGRTQSSPIFQGIQEELYQV